MNVIAVDDELLALKALSKAIGAAIPKAGLTGFRTAAEALDFAKGNPVDVAFLDIELQDMDGLELSKRMKDIRGETNIVFATGYPKYAVDAFSVCASDYLLKPVTPEAVTQAMDRLRCPVHPPRSEVRVQCFGNFEVFYKDRPLVFPRSKSKELFAYLVHRRGSGCTTRELCAVLFEDKAYSVSLSHQMQVIISAMMKTLRAVGVADVIVRNYNSLAVDVTKLDCDYYRYLSWEPEAVNAYTGEYMVNYSWAEFLVGYLDNRGQ